jgi:DNA adenine methylase
MRSPLSGWIGGKHHLVKDIVKRIPEHECYCEPFAGAAWVLFNKEPSEAEVINDINSDIVTLYRVIRFHLREFIEHFKWLLCAREEFQRFMVTPPEVLTDIQRAVRFYYVQRQSFGGRVVNPSYGYSTKRGPRLNCFYLDPPYFRCEDYYGNGLFRRDDFEEVATRYSCGKANQVPVTEVLIRNYPDCAVQHGFSN